MKHRAYRGLSACRQRTVGMPEVDAVLENVVVQFARFQCHLSAGKIERVSKTNDEELLVRKSCSA